MKNPLFGYEDRCDRNCHGSGTKSLNDAATSWLDYKYLANLLSWTMLIFLPCRILAIEDNTPLANFVFIV